METVSQLAFFWPISGKSGGGRAKAEGVQGDWSGLKKMPCWRQGMARMALLVSGQRQSNTWRLELADEIAKWLLRFSRNPLTPDTHPFTSCNALLCQNTLPQPPPLPSPPLRQSLSLLLSLLSCRPRHRLRHRRCPHVAAAAFS